MNNGVWHRELTQCTSASFTIIIQDGEMNDFPDRHLFCLFLTWGGWGASNKQWVFCCCLFAFLPSGIWDLSSPIRDQTCIPCSGSTVLTSGLPGNS